MSNKYTVKTDFWGNNVYYDAHGNEIGKEQSSWLGGKAIYKNGSRVADISVDSLGNESITVKSNSLFGSDKRMENSSNKPDWMFNQHGEYDGGGDD